MYVYVKLKHMLLYMVIVWYARRQLQELIDVVIGHWILDWQIQLYNLHDSTTIDNKYVVYGATFAQLHVIADCLIM